jgi:diaminopimelate epimerase
MHGCGNDFVIFDGRRDQFDLSPETIAMLADRHLGVGCDQMISMRADPDADAFMQIFNADGTPAGACGNATRCVADLIMREKDQDTAVLRTEAGLLHADRQPDGRIQVDMGPVKLDWSDIPLARPMDTLHMALPGEPAAVNMGNPHVTFFVSDIETTDVAVDGPRYENDALFPERVNVGFAQIMDQTTIRLRVWERGAGLTLACGSGACAALVNACRRGLTQRKARVLVDGGALDIAWRDDGHVIMGGPATTVFSGEVDLP